MTECNASNGTDALLDLCLDATGRFADATGTSLPYGGAFRLLEPLAYPRAEHYGPLRSGVGLPLHGAYERVVPGGYAADIINNGSTLACYRYPISQARDPFSSPKHSFANLVHAIPDMWKVGAHAERPDTDSPASEYPLAQWRSLWTEPIGLQLVIKGRKPCALLGGSEQDVASWTEIALAQGLLAQEKARWINGLGIMHVLATIAAPGPVATLEQADALADFYRQQLPDRRLAKACQRLTRVSGADLLKINLASPATDADLVLTGWAFGYPPASTASVLGDTHSY